MRPPHVYTATQIKHWSTDTPWRGPSGYEGGWRPARPEPGPLWAHLSHRVVIAWLVLIGHYDALDWE